MGAYNAVPDPLAGLRGPLRGGDGEGKGEEGKGKGGEGQGGRGRRGRVESDAQLEQGRRLAKAGPVASAGFSVMRLTQTDFCRVQGPRSPVASLFLIGV